MRGFAHITDRPKHATYTITKHGRPIGTYLPYQKESGKTKKKYTLKDLAKFRFNSKEKDLCSRIDEIVYGV